MDAWILAQYLSAVEDALLSYMEDGDRDKCIRAIEAAVRAWRSA